MLRISLLVSLLNMARRTSSEPCHVVIVGAGISGLAAGQTLRRLNCSVVVLEATDELGGRTKTLTSGPFAGVEFGAHWVHGGLENEISAPLLSYLGIPIVPVGGNDDFEGRRGDFDIYDGAHCLNVTERQRIFHMYYKVVETLDDFLDAKVDAYCDGSDDCRAADIDVGRAWNYGLKALKKIQPPPSKVELRGVDLLRRLAFEQDGGSILSNISGRVQELNAYTSFYPKRGHGDAFIEGGYLSLVRALAVGLDIHLSTPALSIKHDSKGVTVATPNGDFSAAHAIVTPFAHVVQRIHFEPSLPDWKHSALSHIGAGKVGKALVLLKEPLLLKKGREDLYTFARLGGEDEIISMCVRSAAEHPRLSNFNFNRTLECFIGAGALDKTTAMTPQERIAAVQTQLRESFESVEVEVVEISPWVQDPYIGLAWSYAPVGSVEKDFLDYAKQHNRVHFAGEASCFLMRGNVHAALASSSRSVMEILSNKDREAAKLSEWPLLRESVYRACEHQSPEHTFRGMFGSRGEPSSAVLV